jgi:hypothetical protein
MGKPKDAAKGERRGQKSLDFSLACTWVSHWPNPARSQLAKCSGRHCLQRPDLIDTELRNEYCQGFEVGHRD